MPRHSALSVFLLFALPSSLAGLQQEGDAPVAWELAYTADLAANVNGGLRRGTVGLGNLDAVVRVDGAAALGWEGATFFAYALANHGGRLTKLMGDVQTASSIEAPTAARLFEAWFQQNLPGPHLSLLLGLYDVNSEFDVLDQGGLFVNSSFGMGAEFASAGLNGPSTFPVTSLGARIQWRPTPRWHAQAAVLDGVPGDPADPGATSIRFSSDEGALWVAEVGYLHRTGALGRRSGPRLGRSRIYEGVLWRVAVGAWQFTRETSPIDDGPPRRAHPGFYLLAEARPFREGDPSQGLGAFVRLGVADDRAYRLGAYTGAGLTYTGLLPGRDEDRMGVGIATAHNGRSYKEAIRASGRAVVASEKVIELTYRAVVAPWLTVQPDVQIVLHPGTDPAIGNALLLSVRVSVTL